VPDTNAHIQKKKKKKKKSGTSISAAPPPSPASGVLHSPSVRPGEYDAGFAGARGRIEDDNPMSRHGQDRLHPRHPHDDPVERHHSLPNREMDRWASQARDGDDDEYGPRDPRNPRFAARDGTVAPGGGGGGDAPRRGKGFRDIGSLLRFEPRTSHAPIELLVLLLALGIWLVMLGSSLSITFYFGRQSVRAGVAEFQDTATARIAAMAESSLAAGAEAALAVADAARIGAVVVPTAPDVEPGTAGFAPSQSAHFALARIRDPSDASAIGGGVSRVTAVFRGAVASTAAREDRGFFVAGLVSLGSAAGQGSFVEASPGGAEPLTRQVSASPPWIIADNGGGGGDGGGAAAPFSRVEAAPTGTPAFRASDASWFSEAQVARAVAAAGTTQRRWTQAVTNENADGLQITFVVARASATSGTVALCGAMMSLDRLARALHLSVSSGPGLAFIVDPRSMILVADSAQSTAPVSRGPDGAPGPVQIDAARTDVLKAWECISRDEPGITNATVPLDVAAAGGFSLSSLSDGDYQYYANASTICDYGARGTGVAAVRIVSEDGVEWVIVTAVPISALFDDVYKALSYFAILAALLVMPIVLAAYLVAAAVRAPLDETTAIIEGREPIYAGELPRLALITPISNLQRALQESGSLRVKLRTLVKKAGG
jgi:hypothetical protein